eukprot:1381967-Amorphochlora_amoeboformis.AAC.2
MSAQLAYKIPQVIDLMESISHLPARILPESFRYSYASATAFLTRPRLRKDSPINQNVFEPYTWLLKWKGTTCGLTWLRKLELG